MATFNFPDRYKSAGLTAGSEVVRSRQAGFTKLRKDISDARALDLTRLYYGLSVPNGTEWFRKAFAAADVSFSMVDNAREVSILAACLLAAGLEDGVASCGLAPIVASAANTRNPSAYVEFLEIARQKLAAMSVEQRQNETLDLQGLKTLNKPNLETAIAALLAAPDWPKAGALVRQSVSGSHETAKELSNQVSQVLEPVLHQIQDLREEISMLWWYVGGWSRKLDRPYSELPLGTASILAACDLASLSTSPIGPLAAPALLSRLIAQGRNDSGDQLSMTEVIEGVMGETAKGMEIPAAASSNPDIFPIFGAILKADEIGGERAWHLAYRRAAGVDPEIKFSANQLAMQVYRESLLLNSLS
ncbi:MAG: GTPase-associated system all-helical protein GASH [Pseudomonadota bacterium]